jgi:hypothetical protein
MFAYRQFARVLVTDDRFVVTAKRRQISCVIGATANLLPGWRHCDTAAILLANTSSCRLNFRRSMKAKKFLATIVALLSAHAAQAVQMSPLSIQQLSDKAQLVFHGTVREKTVQRDPQGRIYTRIKLEITDVWKGDPTLKSFMAVQAGGVLDEEAVTVEGQDEFSVGEEVVLFLVLNQRGEGVVIGLVQGKFKVAKDATGEKTVHNVFHGRAPGQEQNAIGAKTKRSRLSLADLKTRVQGGRP